MHPSEINDTLAKMVVLVDTREQDTPLFRERVRHFGAWERQELGVGDYSAKLQLPSGESVRVNVAIERKMDFDELANCYCQQRPRFQREFDRAKASGTKLYLLIEGGSWEDAYAGRYHSKMSAVAFVASLLAWLARYECQIIFCRPHTTGKLIKDILYRESKELLSRMVSEGD